MSDLEESMPDCDAFFAEARKWYQSIRIPGELNTRVRAAIESDYEKRETVQSISESDMDHSKMNRSANKLEDT